MNLTPAHRTALEPINFSAALRSVRLGAQATSPSKPMSLLLAGFVVAVVSFGAVGIAAAQGVPAKKAAAPMVFADPSKDPTKPAAGGVKWYWPTHARNYARAKAGNIDLCFLGDSITQGWPGDLFGKYYGSMKAVNFGCGGDKIQNMLMRLEGDDGELNGVSPKVIVLLIGVNNLGVNTAEETAYGIDYTVKYLRKKCPATKVLLLGLLPNKGNDGDKLKAVNKIISKLDDGKDVRYLDMGPKFVDKDGKIPEGVLKDAVHLSPKGFEIWAETMNPLLKQMMGK